MATATALKGSKVSEARVVGPVGSGLRASDLGLRI
jgi:hypothetical protein